MQTSNRLPTTHNLRLAYAISLAIAAIMTAASIVGLLYPASLYPLGEAGRWLVANDVLNLIAGLPLLLGSMWLARRGKLMGLICWPGALFYALYVYVAYLIGAPFGPLFLAYLLLVTLSAYTLIGLMISFDGEAIRQRLTGRIPARTSGGILLALAILIILRQIGLIVTVLTSQATVAPLELAQWIDDLVIACPALLLVGIQLWRRRALGYMGGAGLLLQYGVLALGLIPGLLSATPLDVSSVVVILLMAALCFIPFAFFVRGAAAARSSSSASLAGLSRQSSR